MLEQLRRNSRSFIIWILFAIIILAFVFTFGSQGGLQFSGGSGGGDVMEVDGAGISIESWRYGRSSLRLEGSETDRAQFVLDKLLEREILAKAAVASGLNVSKEMVISEYLGKGKFITMGYTQDLLDTPDKPETTGFMKAGYDNSLNPPKRVWLIDDTRLEGFVNQMGLSSIDAFIREQQREVLADMMRSTLRASVAVSEDEARAEFEYENTTATINAVVYRPIEYSKLLVLTDKDAEAYVAKNREKVQAKYDEDERLYKERKPQIRIRQIVLDRPEPEAKDESEAGADKPEAGADKPAAGADKPAAGADKPAAGADKPAADPPAAGAAELPVSPEKPAQPDAGRVAADEAYKRLQAGEDFAAVATEVSQDERSKAKGGDLGWRSAEFPSLGDSRLTESVKALDKGAYSEVIDTPRGYYILQVTDKREGDLSFDQVKLEVAEKMMLDDYAKALARADAEDTLAKLQAGGKMEDMFEKGFQPTQLPPDFWNQLTPEQRQQLLQNMNAPRGSLTIESRDMPAQSGDSKAPAAAEAPAVPAAGAAPVDPNAPADPAAPAPAPFVSKADRPVPRPADVPEPKLQNIGPFRRTADGSIAGLGGESTELVDAIFDDLKTGEIGPKVYEAGDNFVVVEVVARDNPDLSEFDAETKDNMMRDLANLRGYKLVNDWVVSRCLSLASSSGKVSVSNSAITQLLGSDQKQTFRYEICKRLKL